jgi:glutathionyl-hydroquinone reductase
MITLHNSDGLISYRIYGKTACPLATRSFVLTELFLFHEVIRRSLYLLFTLR